MNAQQIAQALQYGELQAFGMAMPRLAADWSASGGTNPFTVVDSTPASSSDPPIMTITSTANWAAPLDATYLIVAGSQPMPATLVQAGGTVEGSPGLLLTVPDQEWLRLSRLYCEILQESDTTRPERDRGLSCRPVPRYFYFPNQTLKISSPNFPSGLARAGDDLGFAGAARFYDSDGLQIDPVAVMAAFEAILTHYPGLQAVPLGSQPVSPIPLTDYLTGSSSPLAATKTTRVRLVDFAGNPYIKDPLHLTGLTVVDNQSALYELGASPAVVDLDAVDTNFTQFDHDRLVFGSAANGRLSGSFTAPEVPTFSPPISLARDYYTLRVVELQPYLNGAWPDNSADPAVSLQRFAPVRINENISFLLDGNDMLGAIHTALDSGSPLKRRIFSAGVGSDFGRCPGNRRQLLHSCLIRLRCALAAISTWHHRRSQRHAFHQPEDAGGATGKLGDQRTKHSIHWRRDPRDWQPAALGLGARLSTPVPSQCIARAR